MIISETISHLSILHCLDHHHLVPFLRKGLAAMHLHRFLSYPCSNLYVVKTSPFLDIIKPSGLLSTPFSITLYHSFQQDLLQSPPLIQFSVLHCVNQLCLDYHVQIKYIKHFFFFSMIFKEAEKKRTRSKDLNLYCLT